MGFGKKPQIISTLFQRFIEQGSFKEDFRRLLFEPSRKQTDITVKFHSLYLYTLKVILELSTVTSDVFILIILFIFAFNKVLIYLAHS